VGFGLPPKVGNSSLSIDLDANGTGAETYSYIYPLD